MPRKTDSVPPARRRDLIRRGHDLQARTTLGRSGLTDAFVAQLDATMSTHDLLKVRIEAESGGEATQLAEALAGRIGAHLIQRVGRVALLHRPLKGS